MLALIAAPERHRRAVPPASALPPRMAKPHFPCPVGTKTSFDRHETIFRAGDAAVGIFEILAGAVMVYQLLEDGRRQVVEVVLLGGMVGFAVNGSHPSTCETLTFVRLHSYRTCDVEHSFELRARIGAHAQAQICVMHQHVLALGRMTAEERVAGLLARFADLGQSEFGRSISLELPMTRGEIGDHLGLSLETICRTLTGFQQKGVLALGKKRGEVIVKNLRHLRQIAGLE